MPDASFQALQAAARIAPSAARTGPRLVIAGATGVLGNEVLRRLVLQLAPPGIHVAAPDVVWRAAQGDLRLAVRQWLGGCELPL